MFALLAGLLLLGYSINTLTLFGMVLAIGIVVDDAIVVVEAVQHRLDTEHADPKTATKAAMAVMAKQGGGSIVNISSIWGMTGAPVAPHYCAAKAALASARPPQQTGSMKPSVMCRSASVYLRSTKTGVPDLVEPNGR